MSYDALEASRDGGAPFFLYQFTKGATVTSFTSLIESIDAMGATFEPAAISHGRILTGGPVKRDTLDIDFPLSHPFALAQLGISTPQRTHVTIWRSHYGDGEFRVIFKGSVQGARPDRIRIRLVVSTVFSSLRNPGLGARMSRTCRHVLYGTACGLVLSEWQADATAEAHAGTTYTIPLAATFSDVYFAGGLLDYDGALAFIVKHVGDQVTTRTAPPGLADAIDASGGLGVAVKIAPGCDRSRPTCETKFANEINHGGAPFMPLKNPFGGNSIV